jgi:hypothetical protein
VTVLAKGEKELFVRELRELREFIFSNLMLFSHAGSKGQQSGYFQETRISGLSTQRAK